MNSEFRPIFNSTIKDGCDISGFKLYSDSGGTEPFEDSKV